MSDEFPWIKSENFLPDEDGLYLTYDGRTYSCVFRNGQFVRENIGYWGKMPNPHRGNWVKLSERRPENAGWYLVTTKNIIMMQDPFRIIPIMSLVDYYDPKAKEGRFGNLFEMYDKWMNLPKPPVNSH